MNKNILQNLLNKKIYLLHSIAGSSLVFLNLFFYRQDQAEWIKFISLLATYFLISAFIVGNYRFIILKKEFLMMAESFELHISKDRLKSNTGFMANLLYSAVVIGITSTLLVFEVFPKYQLYIDIAVFLFFVTEIYRGLNARYHIHLLQVAIDELINEHKD